MKQLKLKIATPEKVILEKEVEQITLPTKSGEITILSDHVPLISIVAAGIIETKTGKEVSAISISGGFLEFHDNEVVILADTAEHADEIDLQRAEEARKKAEEMKSDANKALDERQYAAAISQIEKQLARIRAVKRYSPKTKHGMSMKKEKE